MATGLCSGKCEAHNLRELRTAGTGAYPPVTWTLAAQSPLPSPTASVLPIKLDSGLSPRTVQYVHVLLYKALKQAVRWMLVPRNVAEAVDPPKIQNE